MPTCTLDNDGQKRLEFVLRRMKECPSTPDYINLAVAESMSGVNDKARRTYLRGELLRRAKQNLRAQKKKEASKLLQKLMDDPDVIQGAWGHEKEILSRIPEKDR